MKPSINTIINTIEQLASQMMETNSLFKKLKLSPPTQYEVSKYLSSAHFLITFTQPNLRSALLSATKAFNKDLAQYFFNKIFEEIGHEKWAEDDLSINKLEREQPVSAIVQLTEYLTYLSANTPTQYAAYILVSEYITSQFGREILKLFRALPEENNKLTVLSKHIELDDKHVISGEDFLKNILENVSASEFEKILEAVKHSIYLIDQSFKEIYEYSQSKFSTSSITTPAARELGNI